MAKKKPGFDARKLVSSLNKVIAELESPLGMWQVGMTYSAQQSSKKLADAARGLGIKRRTGKLFHAIENSYKATREFGNFTVILNDERMMDQLLPRTTNRFIGYTYPSYWRLLLEGWGARGKGRPLYRNLAIIYDYADGSINYTSPYDPKALNPESTQRVTFSRHPGSWAKNWLRLMRFPLEKETAEFGDWLMQRILNKHMR